MFGLLHELIDIKPVAVCRKKQKILKVKQPVFVDRDTSRVKVNVMHFIFFLLAGGGGDNPCVQGSLLVIPQHRCGLGPGTGNLSSR